MFRRTEYSQGGRNHLPPDSTPIDQEYSLENEAGEGVDAADVDGERLPDVYIPTLICL